MAVKEWVVFVRRVFILGLFMYIMFRFYKGTLKVLAGDVRSVLRIIHLIILLK